MKNMNSLPLLSIVVPTKNRYKYLKYLIELIQQFRSEDIELVIQDNSDCNVEIVEYIESNCFHGLKYYYESAPISIKENIDMAIFNSSGEYVCVLGDDDGVLSDIVQVVHYMRCHSIDCLISLPTYYNWPDFYDPSIFHLTSAISYSKGSGRYIKLDSKKELYRSISNGFNGLYRMPKVYQGMVSRALLNKIFDKCNTFFPGPSPDMANAVALSLLGGNFYLYDAPMFISGQCRSFGGNERVIGTKNLKRINEVPFLPQNIEETWCKKLPPYWCADTIWPQSGIEALLVFEENVKISYNQILAQFFFNHPNYIQHYSYLIDNRWEYIFYFLKYLFKKGYNFLYHRLSYFLSLKTRLKQYRIKHNVYTIIDAVNFLEDVK